MFTNQVLYHQPFGHIRLSSKTPQKYKIFRSLGEKKKKKNNIFLNYLIHSDKKFSFKNNFILLLNVLRKFVSLPPKIKTNECYII